MGTYIARRLLLMVPTMLGISFLVFMLVALSPGGIGASLGDSTGDVGRGGGALARAYFDDRYGLDEPVLVQYARWLGRICPLKFGRPDQADPDGNVIPRPRPLRPPTLWGWFAAELPAAPPGAPLDAEAAQREYPRAAGDYADRRAAFIAAEVRLRAALTLYARAAGVHGELSSAGEVRPEALAKQSPERARAEWARVEHAGHEAVQRYGEAIAARARLIEVLDAGPFGASGLVLVPGALSIAAPDLGRSAASQPVATLIGRALPVTLMLNLLAFPAIYAVAIPGGVLAAARAGGRFDRITGLVFVALWSIPIIWAGTMAVGFLADRRYLGWFPVSGLHSPGADSMAFLPGPGADGRFETGWLVDTLWHIPLPVACLSYAGFAVLAKQTRAAMMDGFSADYVRTARAKGVPERDIALRHVLRNSLLPLITMFVQLFPAMLAGSVVVERVFSIPGMGSLLLAAIQERDREVILANTIIIAGVNVLALLLADVLYAAADPRVSYE